MAGAFQRSAFQNNAFQTDAATGGGGDRLRLFAQPQPQTPAARRKKPVRPIWDRTPDPVKPRQSGTVVPRADIAERKTPQPAVSPVDVKELQSLLLPVIAASSRLAETGDRIEARGAVSIIAGAQTVDAADVPLAFVAVVVAARSVLTEHDTNDASASVGPAEIGCRALLRESDSATARLGHSSAVSVDMRDDADSLFAHGRGDDDELALSLLMLADDD